MKVFCKDCKFVRSSSDCFGGVYCRCVKAKVVKTVDHPTHKSRCHESIKDRNSDNDCPDYKKSNLLQKIYANTCG